MKLYTESELAALPMPQVKEIATAMGRKPSQGIRNRKSAWVSCIVRHQAQIVTVAPVQPEIVVPEQKDWAQATDLEVAIACVESDEFFGYDSTKSRERVARLREVELPNSPELDVVEYAPTNCDDDLSYNLTKRAGNRTLQVWSNGEYLPYKDAVCASWRKLIGTIKIQADGVCEYFTGVGLSIGRNKIASTIEEAIDRVKVKFINSQHRDSHAAWCAYLS